jgi:peroxisomal membrane protein 2
MITAGCLAGVSDSVAQKLSGYQKIERRRLLLKMVRTPMLFFFWVSN